MDVLAAALPLADTLERLGARPPLCIGASPGTPIDPTAPRSPEPIVLDVRACDTMEAIRASLDALADLPPWACARVDAFDPDHGARVLGTLFDDGRPVAGRAKYGARPEAWQQLEDKTTVDVLWDAAGVARAPSVSVPVDGATLRQASMAHDRGCGSVWTGDNRGGFHGAATFVRWIRSNRDADEAMAFFAPRCDRVRVMPFLDGIPCSIHALVLPDRTLAFRPCEMIVLRRPGESRLQYAQAATFWDPPDEDREVMRTVARQVGEHLRTTLGYRGFLTVDGVMTAAGFLPTELNPRVGAALGWLNTGLDLSLTLLHAAIIEGEPIDWDPDELEVLLISNADARRGGRGMVVIPTVIEERREQRIAIGSDGVAHEAEEGEAADATVVLGPSAIGGVVVVNLDAGRTPVGPSVAARVASSLAWADARWSLGIGPLEPAPDLRARRSAITASRMDSM